MAATKKEQVKAILRSYQTRYMIETTDLATKLGYSNRSSYYWLLNHPQKMSFWMFNQLVKILKIPDDDKLNLLTILSGIKD